MGATGAPYGTKAFGPKSKATDAIEAVVGAPYGTPHWQEGLPMRDTGAPHGTKASGPKSKATKAIEAIVGPPYGTDPNLQGGLPMGATGPPMAP